MEDEKLSIRLNLADRYYPLKIDPNDEEKIRKAAKLINEKILQYKQRYANKDTQDFLAMAALQFVIKYLEMDEQENSKPITDELEALNEELDNYLEKEEYKK
jgi:cell division protein ZapA